MFRALLRRPEARLFFIISVLFYICIHSIDAFLAPMMINQGIEPQVMGIIMGASGLATLMIRFPLGIISDVVKSRKIFIQIALVLPIIAWPIAWLEPNAITLYLAKAADGVTAATWVLYNILFIRYFDRKEAPAAVALLALAGPIGVFLGNCIGGVLIHYFANNIAFFVSCVSALLALFLTTRIRDVHDPVQAPSLKACIAGAKLQLADRSVWLIGILATIVILVPFATRDTLTPIYAEQLGARAGILTLLSNIHLIFYALAIALCSSVFYQRLGLVKTAVLGILLQVISSFGIPFTSNLYLIYLLQALAGFSFGMAFAAFMSLSVVNTTSDEQSTRMGLFQTIYSCGMFAGPVIMGVMMQHINLSSGYLFIAGLSIIAAIATPLSVRWVYSRKTRQPVELSTNRSLASARE
ncbi:MFS transporter [Enterobacter sp. RHB15-C17]|jgi:MFS family permease|uniref:MFS transporter n=2 Tax=Lelliottia nimipressuralis TaxID=69220 RepID=A0ABY3P499_9ENTR|nr:MULTISPECIES: MFS transporter [Lelliottia]MCY1699324.1 MFS transporter [Lelliottia sp. SL45]MDH6632929.1 MFS family permease [Lelliottia amnigena]QMM52699.1 MFS transporter [Enterobacter sp. RHB15-C17]TYT34031.1 MFS transporter [Lelliottia nimipressuralis]